ncbi:putative reverse transcriptase domain-containing protein [Tanacetum coccineum]
MSSDSASSEVTYTSISSHGDLLAWAVDFFRLQEPDSSEAAPAPPDYVPGPEESEQVPLSPYYVPGPEYPEYLAPSDEEVPIEDQPYAVADSPIALSPGYIADSDPEEDPEEDSEDGPVDYPADGGDDDDDDSSDDDKEEEEASEEEEAKEEEEEHLALADSVAAPVAPVLFPPEEEVERLLALPTPPPSPLTSLSPPSIEEHLARCLAAPALPSSPLPRLPHPYGSPNHLCAPSGFRAAIGRLRASSPLPPPVPATLPLPSPPLPPLPSSPLPPLPDSSFIPPVDCREDIPEAELPPRKRLCLTSPALRYEVRESLTAVPRPTGGRKVDYRFVGTLDAKAKRQRAEVVSYGIKDTWVDPRETTKEVAPVTIEGVNTRVIELTVVQEQDTQEIYAVIEDTQDRQTQIYQTVETLVDDSQYHYETARLLDQEALVSREAWAHSMGLSSAVYYELQRYRTHGHLATTLGEIRALQAREQARADVPEDTASTNNMPLKRTSAATKTARATAAAAAAAAPMTVAAVEQLGTEGVVVLSQWFKKTKSVFHISNCAPENQVKFATCTFIRNSLTWWNSHKKAVTQEVAYAMDWKALKKLMTVKYCPRGEIKKLEIELWNLKESDEVEKYVSGLPDMIRGNVMSYRPQTMEEVIKFANDQMDQKLINISERQAEQKRKIEFNVGNNQGYQQQNKRQNTGRAYTARTGEKREYTGSLPLCTKCNYYHKGPCAPSYLL